MRRPASLSLIALSLLVAALLWKLATYGGILLPATRLIGLIALAALVVVWAKGRGGTATVLDRPLLLWALAFGVAFFANLEAWRRIVVGFWYVGVYVGLWYVFHDLLASRRLRRETLADALLLGGAVVV